jgi:hypothetical protein
MDFFYENCKKKKNEKKKEMGCTRLKHTKQSIIITTLFRWRLEIRITTRLFSFKHVRRTICSNTAMKSYHKGKDMPGKVAMTFIQLFLGIK